MIKPKRRAARQTNNAGNANHASDANGDSANEYRQAARTILLLDRLGEGPRTNEELAEEFKVNGRTIRRHLNAMSKAGAPLYVRRRRTIGGAVVEEWYLDGEMYRQRFEPTR